MADESPEDEDQTDRRAESDERLKRRRRQIRQLTGMLPQRMLVIAKRHLEYIGQDRPEANGAPVVVTLLSAVAVEAAMNSFVAMQAWTLPWDLEQHDLMVALATKSRLPAYRTFEVLAKEYPLLKDEGLGARVQRLIEARNTIVHPRPKRTDESLTFEFEPPYLRDSAPEHYATANAFVDALATLPLAPGDLGTGGEGDDSAEDAT